MVNSLRGVGQVRFAFDGVPTAVKKGNSLLSRVGEALSYDDYSVLLVTVPDSSLDDTPDGTTTTTIDG
jgi:hypothetical protein